jgi:hypothetical protein
MGRSNMCRSRTSRRSTPKHPRHPQDTRAMPSTLPNIWGCRPDIQLLHHAHRRPPAPPSGTAIPTYHRSRTSHDAARPSRLQPKVHRQTTRRPRPSHQHPGPPSRREVKPPPLRRVDRADNLAAQATQDCRPSQAKQQPCPMKLLPTKVPEAAASTYIHPPGPSSRR